MDNELNNNTEDSIFDGGDFVFMERTGGDGKKEIIGGGYKVNSFFLEKGISPMTTFNSPNNEQEQHGGKVSSPFENLAVPAGLFYINQKFPKNYSENQDNFYQKHTMASDDMIDKLFGLVEADKKRKRKTRRQIDKPNKNNKKTRRQK